MTHTRDLEERLHELREQEAATQRNIEQSADKMQEIDRRRQDINRRM